MYKRQDAFLSEDDLKAIIQHAKEKKITLIPGINMPGHMDAIVTIMREMNDLGEVRFSAIRYGQKNFSATTMDFENEKAVSFLKSLLDKYLTFFKSQGINDFNFGADEIGNDALKSNEGGYGHLNIHRDKYEKLVQLINELSQAILDKGMQPYVFNDGMYYDDNTSVRINPKLNVFYWSAGGRSWGGPKYAKLKTITDRGHKVINTNDNWYYVLGRENLDNGPCLLYTSDAADDHNSV